MTRELSRHAGRGSGTGASAGATEGPVARRLLAALRDARHRTLFAPELAAVARDAGCDTDQFEQLLVELERAGQILVVGRHPPDVHLAEADLRTVHACDDLAPDPAPTRVPADTPTMPSNSTRPESARRDHAGTGRIGPDRTRPDRVELARRRGEEHWAEFLRTFLATRRCC